MNLSRYTDDTTHELKRLNFAGGGWAIAKRTGGSVISHYGLNISESYATLRWETVKIGEPATLWADNGHRGNPREVTTPALLSEDIL